MLLPALAWTCGAISVASFVCFVILAFGERRATAPSRPSLRDAELRADLGDVAKLLEAIAKLTESLAKFTDSLAKAGPAIASLVSSMIFMGLAVILAHLSR